MVSCGVIFPPKPFQRNVTSMKLPTKCSFSGQVALSQDRHSWRPLRTTAQAWPRLASPRPPRSEEFPAPGAVYLECGGSRQWGRHLKGVGETSPLRFCTKSNWNHEEQVLTYKWGWVAVRSFTRIMGLQTAVSEPGYWTHCNEPPRVTPQAGTRLRPFLGTQATWAAFLGWF